MSGENIEYTIINKKLIVPTEGKIDCIVQKKSDGFQVAPCKKFDFEIKLKGKAIIALI
jgi:hypothetical protein